MMKTTIYNLLKSAPT